jgi:hypothetical protein
VITPSVQDWQHGRTARSLSPWTCCLYLGVDGFTPEPMLSPEWGQTVVRAQFGFRILSNYLQRYNFNHKYRLSAAC